MRSTCRATTADLLDIAKALFARVVGPDLYVVAGHAASFLLILPLRMPLKGRRSLVRRSNFVSELGGAKRARTADLLHAMNHQHVHGRHHTLRQLRKH